MKNIFVAAIFLFSQIGFSAEKANQVQAKKFQIEDLTFSGLLLTKEEIIHLNEDDKAKYLFAMIAMGQILEGSQRYHMGYDYTAVAGEKTVMDVNLISPKYAAVFKFFVPQANAFLALLARVGVAVAPVLMRAGAWVVARAEGAMASGAAQAAKKAGRMAFEFAPSKEALKKMSVTVAEKAKNLKSAQEKLVSALKKNPGSQTALKEEAAVAEARAAFTAEKEVFLKAGGTEAQFASAAKESGLKKVLMWPFRNAKSLAVGGLATYGADTLLQEKTGISIGKLMADGVENAAIAVERWVAGTDLSGPGTLTPEQLKAGDSAQDAGKTCLFGGHGSVWKEFADGDIKCTRPASASNDNCKQSEGKFQCPSYNIKLASGSIDSSLCIDTVKLDNLTVRCVNTLKAVLEAKQATLDSKEAAVALQKNFGEVLASLEARDRMKNEKGQTKSIFEYCAADSVAQKEECGVIKEMLGLLKTTDIVKIYEGRPKVAAAAPAAGAPEAGKTETKQ